MYHTATLEPTVASNISALESKSLNYDLEDEDEEEPLTRKQGCMRFLSILGPGLMVCLADTDGPCLITAASSGSEYGYSLLLVQLVLIPILYAAQELTVRLALVKKMGLTELLKDAYGSVVAWTACVILLITCIGALMSEFSAVGQVGQMWGCPAYALTPVMVFLLLMLVFFGSFRIVEKIGVCLGCCQLIFIPVMFLVEPDWLALLKGLGEFHFDESRWVALVAANIGAVIMPWMLYYQQSACVQRGLTVKDLKYARWDTAIGAFLTQVVMSSMVVVLAATMFVTNRGELTKLSQILDSMEPSLGSVAAKVLLSLGIIGACLVAAIVVTICPAWSLCECLGYERKFEKKYSEAKTFYNNYFVMLIIAAVVASIPGVGDSTILSIQIEILNAVLMPAVIFFIFILCINPKVMPEKHRLKGWYMYLLGVIFAICSGFCVYAAIRDVIDMSQK